MASTESTGKIDMATQNTSPKTASPKGSTPGTAGDPENALKRNWWTTLPGLLTGTAAVITALTGLVAVFVPRDGPTDRPAAETQAPQAAATPPAPPSEAPAKPDQAQPDGQSVKTGDIGAGAQVNIQQKQ
jgi:hypothetical protein